MPFGVANATCLTQKCGTNHLTVGTGLVFDEVAGVFGFGTPGILANLAEWGTGGTAGTGLGIGTVTVIARRHISDF
jgi:hypothetical protein